MHTKQAVALRLSVALSLFLGASVFFLSNGRAGDPADKLSFDRDIRPILSDNCYACHGFDADAREAGLRLDHRGGAVDDGGVIVPGEPELSVLVDRIFSTDEHDRMPPPDSGKSLTDVQKRKLRAWIKQGAEYETHWAFVPPQNVLENEPATDRMPIDHFVTAKLAKAGLTPSPPAKPATLIRRVSLDLIGLPPTADQIAVFERAAAVDFDLAYRDLVQRLLASPHYGERWGRWWLDQARYADSNGYSIDGPRSIWPYRDWVVDALNRDMPFDQFTIEQLAGDLLPTSTDPHVTQQQQVATGFHRNTPINQEGGIDREQFRIDSIFDRVATTGTVWLGLTIGCAQCHDHKFDPLTQKEFYELFAFFNDQDEPNLTVYPREPDQDADADAKHDRGIKTMVLAERSKPRDSTVLIKGDFTRPADPVTPGVPGVLHPLDSSGQRATRLDLARWIVSPQNPLTARVIVNRIWQQYFGRGLVETESDFGLQGTSPSHPKLLDWLAVELVRSEWSLKNIHRQIVTSETYRQSSRVRSDLVEVDPLNLLLGRQNRLRLDAEIVRDVALVASDMLVPTIGGPPVYPPIPDGVMGLGQVQRSWDTSTGAGRYRRGLYTFVFRATPPPSLNVFDAPDGQSSCTRRIRSNTPLQALTLMNDAAFFEFAQSLSQIIETEGLATAFRRCTSRPPDPQELAVLEKLDSLTAARVLLNLDETINRE